MVTRRFAHFHSTQTFTGLLIAFLLSLPSNIQAAENPAAHKLWEKQFSGEILAIINSDSNRTTLNQQGGELVSLYDRAVGFSGQGQFHLTVPPGGVLLLAVQDKKEKYVQLIALDSHTGEQLWSLACTALEVNLMKHHNPYDTSPAGPASSSPLIHSSVLVSERQVLVLQQQDPARRFVVAYDIRTGIELWRREVSSFRRSEMILQVVPQFNKGLTGRIVKPYIQQQDLETNPVSQYMIMPERRLVIDPSEGNLNVWDLDTGASMWRIEQPMPVVMPNLNEMTAMTGKHKPAPATHKVALPDASVSSMLRHMLHLNHLFIACTPSMALYLTGSGQCASVRAYRLTDGELDWEFEDPAGEIQGWMPVGKVGFVRYRQKTIVLELASGKKLYETADERVGRRVVSPDARSYSGDDRIFWVDREGDRRSLLAIETTNGNILWEVPLPNEEVVEVLPRKTEVALATPTEFLVLDAASGKEVLRNNERSGSIRALAAVDEHDVLVISDGQVVRYDDRTWKAAYRASLPSPKSSAWGEIVLTAIAVGLSAVPVPTMTPGGLPTSYTNVPYGMTPQGLVNISNMLNSQSGDLIQQLERRSSRYCYLRASDSIYRIDIDSGKIERIGSVSREDSILAVDEMRGVAASIRRKSVAAYLLPGATMVTPDADAAETLAAAHSTLKRAQQAESADPAKAKELYLSVSANMSGALTIAVDVGRKAALHLALAGVYSRLAALTPLEPAWLDQSGKENRAVRDLACTSSQPELHALCQAATPPPAP